MKFAVVYCIYDDREYLEVSVFPFKIFDKVLFLMSDVPWCGAPSDNSATIKYLKNLCAENKNFELAQGHWTDEATQRNFGLSKLFQEGYDYSFIVDTDEIYNFYHVQHIINFVLNHPQHTAFHIEWNTYWTKKYYKIDPREEFKPVIVVKNSEFNFTKMRLGTTSIMRAGNVVMTVKSSGYNGITIPSDIAICYHLSYARTDEVLKRKIETFSHAPEVKDWYEKVWKQWTPSKKNLHPVTPSQYKQAIKENFISLPRQLKKHIKRERMLNTPCSIIILNWNSCELLKRCLYFIQKNTNFQEYKIIIVDNGSTKDDSVEFLSKQPFTVVFNKINLGFAGGINEGLKVADPDSDICLLNVDAEVQEDWLKELYKTLIKHPDCGIVGPLGQKVKSNYQCEGMVKKDTLVANLHFYCVLISREVFNKIGVLDTRYEIGCWEDNDFGTRAKLAGYNHYISAKSLVRHEAHQVFKLNGLNPVDYEEINRKKFFDKIYGILYTYSQVHDFYENEDLARLLGLIL